MSDGRQGPGPWDGVAGNPADKQALYNRGGFVNEIDRFDARFFGIKPIEARMMDPRQRLLLETSWQALEDAGMDPARLKGSHAGIYAGVGSSEYRDLIAAGGEVGSYLGTAGSLAVGRVAYALGFMGPAIPLDMTCASSLVAVHQAVSGLQQDEVNLALAGGVNTVLSPAVTRFMMEFGMLSASGQCRPFDAGADGFLRGEGCGIVVLKRLSEAEADGDRIWGVIRGSAVNQNGASAGLTVPNGPAQEQVLEEALQRAGIPPSQVDYLEAHGTGSELGDPMEVQAAAAVYGRGRAADRPLLIGSLKGNIGHLEWAAGIASLIKVVLAMQRGVIPKLLHFRNPSQQMDWDQLPVNVTSEATDWPGDSGRPPRAGVSAFGLSGTNAHVVVEGYGKVDSGVGGRDPEHWAAGPGLAVNGTTPEPAEDLAARMSRFLPLSAKSDQALRELAQRYLSWLDVHAQELAQEGQACAALLADMAWTAGVGRSHFPHRAGVVFRDAASLRSALSTLAEAEKGPGPHSSAKVAFVFTGQASQWAGMGEVLYESEPEMREVLNRCDAWCVKERGFLCWMSCSGAPVSQNIWTIRRGHSRQFMRWNVG